MTAQANNRNLYALITGATSGIGYELARLFAQDGYNLILVARSDERLQKTADELKQFGVEVTIISRDLFKDNAAQEIYDEIKKMGVQVNILVNDAGQGQHGKLADIPLKRHLEIIHLNIVSLVSLTKLFLDDMITRNEGKILQLASVVSKTPVPEFSVYAASKAFVLSFSEALAKELEGTNVSLTVLLPGRTDTDFFYKADMQQTKEYQEHHLTDPAKVAKDGYEALMSGQNKIIPGIENKLMVGMMNTMPDNMTASQMQKNMQPSDKSERTESTHPASQSERETVEKERMGIKN
ncbi:MAG: short-chain dehydrogenase/reductase [Chitinophagaceae bacterium]|nr:short-chain dehydrogenase/reductase [Chitinophagaceae bacterium]